jgi:hypothetical protein
LRSQVKVSQRSLQYVTHHLMVMHPHTKYNWPIWKDKKDMVRTSFDEKKWKKKFRLKQYVSLRSKARHKYQERGKLILLTHRYMKTHFSVLVQAQTSTLSEIMQ